MALTAALLANGQLPASKGTLYTAAAAVIIKTITLVNTDSVARTVNLYVKRTTSRRIIPVNLSLNAGVWMGLDDAIALSAGDLIEGDASAATVVDYVVMGASA